MGTIDNAFILLLSNVTVSVKHEMILSKSNNKIKIFCQFFFKILILLFLFLILTNCSNRDKNPILAKKGVLNLINYDFPSKGTIALNGEWEFYWNKLLKSDDFILNTNTISYFNIPNKWNGYKSEGNIIPNFGYATYRLQIIMKPDNNFLYGIKIREISSAYQLWFNNRLIASNGIVSSSEKDYLPKWLPRTVYFILTNQTNEIILQTANYSHVDSGVIYNILFGISSKIENIQRENSGFELFLFGALLITGLYHLGLYYFRRKDRSSLYFGLFCLLIALRTFITGERNLIQIFPGIPWVVSTKTEYLITPLTPILFFNYLRVLYPYEITKRFMIIQQILAYFYIIIIFFFSEKIYSMFFVPYFLPVVIAVCYAIICLFKALLRKRENALIVIIGFIVIAVSVINDFLYTNLVINTALTIPFGVFIFIFSQSLLLSMRFSKAFSEVEDLSKKLEIYNVNLEELVSSRTKELEIANKQIEQDKNLLKVRNDIMENELEMAKKIQLQLIPQKSPFANISFHYKPMEKIGGDFFDIIQYRDPNLIGLFVSDVSGHGVPAAFITSMLKTSMNQIHDEYTNPSDVLYYLNNSLYGQTDGNFITVFYGIFNKTTREFTYANAGHNPPFIINSEKIAPLDTEGSGLPLAILKNDELRKNQKKLTDKKIILEKHSKLLMYTDGLIETVNKKEKDTKTDLLDFESSLLNATLKEFSGKTADEFIKGLWKKLLLFRGSDDFDDDICMLCMEV